jgi:ribosomal protein S18 acetylase RimI-like enzyme
MLLMIYDESGGRVGITKDGVIHSLYVPPKQRRKGVATRLVDEAKKMGGTGAWVENTPEAIGFWSRYGHVPEMQDGDLQAWMDLED